LKDQVDQFEKLKKTYDDQVQESNKLKQQFEQYKKSKEQELASLVEKLSKMPQDASGKGTISEDDINKLKAMDQQKKDWEVERANLKKQIDDLKKQTDDLTKELQKGRPMLPGVSKSLSIMTTTKRAMWYSYIVLEVMLIFAAVFVGMMPHQTGMRPS